MFTSFRSKLICNLQAVAVASFVYLDLILLRKVANLLFAVIWGFLRLVTRTHKDRF